MADGRRVVVVATHPIQYQVPWFQRLAVQPGIELKVLYAAQPTAAEQGIGFGAAFAWDIPLLEGYDWEWLPSVTWASPLSGFWSVRVRGMTARLQQIAPAVVILTGWNSLPLLQALWACRRLGIPCAVRGDSNALKPRSPWMRVLHRRLLSQYDAMLAVGKANRAFYLDNGVRPDRLFSCPHFVDNDRFRRQAEALQGEREALRAAWSVPPQAVCCLYAGKLEPKKRILDLLQALEWADPAAGRLYLLVVGTGELMAEATAFAEAHRLPVTFAGFLNQSEIARAYVAADVLALPSDYGETWGLVVNEAMACGRPALVSDRVGCGPDLVEEGVTGAIFPCGDIAALAQRLQDLAADPQRLRDMGRRAQERVLRDYSVERAVAGTGELIQVLGTRG